MNLTLPLAVLRASTIFSDSSSGTAGSFAPMENPDRYMSQPPGCVRVAATANGHQSGEAFRRVGGEGPGAEAAHAQPGDINPVLVHLVLLDDLVKEGRQFIGPPRVIVWALWRHHQERELLARRN